MSIPLISLKDPNNKPIPNFSYWLITVLIMIVFALLATYGQNINTVLAAHTERISISEQAIAVQTDQYQNLKDEMKKMDNKLDIILEQINRKSTRINP